MHSPWSQKFPFPFWPSQALKHFPQCSRSSSVLTQTPLQICSPGPVHSPPVLVCVVPVSVPCVVPLVWLVDDESLPDEVLSEVDDDDEVDDDVSEVDVDVEVEVEVDDVEDESEVVGVDDDAVSEVDTPFVLDIESDPAVDALIDALIVAAVVSSPSPLQAKRVRPTSAASTTGAEPWTEQSNAEQKGQRLSLSQTWREQSGQRCTKPTLPRMGTVARGPHDSFQRGQGPRRTPPTRHDLDRPALQ